MNIYGHNEHGTCLCMITERDLQCKWLNWSVQQMCTCGTCVHQVHVYTKYMCTPGTCVHQVHVYNRNFYILYFKFYFCTPGTCVHPVLKQMYGHHREYTNNSHNVHMYADDKRCSCFVFTVSMGFTILYWPEIPASGRRISGCWALNLVRWSFSRLVTCFDRVTYFFSDYNINHVIIM